MSEPLLRVEGLGVAYGALVALADVTWDVSAGEILGVIGPNGAGKSSCYDAVTHLTKRTRRVFFGGQDVTDLRADRLARLGLKRAFQQNAFFNEISVLENMTTVLQDAHGVGLFATLAAPWFEARRRRAAEHAACESLVRFGVPQELHGARPPDIPYGVQRMLSIALAHGAGARALMLDEPAAGLGGVDMTRLVQLLRDLKRDGLALVVIEHHMDLVMSIADRIVVLDQGRMLAIGTPREIQADARVREAYLGRAA
jgi:branched-chain amino acid transport system ATP-binding protein